MTKLKTILCSKYFYLFILVLAIINSIFYFNRPHTSKLDSNDNTFIGTILEIEVEGDYLKLKLKGKEKIIGNYFFSSEEEKNTFLITYELGDTVYLTGTFSIPSNNTVPNLFNYKEYLKRQHIYYVMNIDTFEKVRDNQSLFYQIKNNILKHIENYQSKGYLKTFILGDNNLLSNQTITTYQENGISHLFAISGMHISLLSGILLFLFKKINLSERKSYVIVDIFLFFYMILSGCSPSICRAVILFTLLGMNRILNLKISTIYLLIVTFSCLIIVNPYFLLDIGFQYSFAISFYLLLFQNKFNKTSYIKGLFQVSIVSFLVSFPISIYYFYQVNFLSILLNLFFVPFVSILVFPLSLLTFLFPFLDSIFQAVTILLEKISSFCNQISFLKIIWMKPSIIWIILYYFCFTIMLFKRRKLGIFMMILLLGFEYFYLLLFPKTFFLMIDVGQGDSLLIHSNNETVLIDTGGKIIYEKENWQKRVTTSLADNAILPLLKSLGIRKLEYLVLSHGDYDHMGEAKNLVNQFKIKKVIFNRNDYNDLEQELIKILNSKNIPYDQNTEKVHIGICSLYFLNTKIYDNENDNSNVIYTNINGNQLLLMGDAGIEKENDILKKYHFSNIDFLKVGHHGSDTSSSKYFINSIHPQNSLISVGKNNRYHHPKNSVLDILSESQIYRTDQDGSIEIQFKNSQYSIKTYRP